MNVHDKLFIGGEWVAPEGKGVIEVISPHSEEVIGTVPDASTADIDKAIAAARNAFDNGPWPKMSPEERGEGIKRLSAALSSRAQDIADLISAQNGSPKSWSIMGQVFSATMVLDTYANLASGFNWEEERTGALGSPVRVRRAPVGVAAGIIPWNVPLFICALKLGPAMAAGCPIVLKPAPETPLDAYLLAEAVLEADLPPGVVNIVAAGREVSEHILTHPSIDKVSFTGSTAVGRHIGSVCGGLLKRVTLELGGKSAAIVLDDVNLDEAMMSQLVQSGVMNNGQVCGAQSRILVSRKRYDEVVEALGAAVGALKVGDPLDIESEIGPLVAARQRDRVVGFLESGVAEGARVVTGGGTPADLDKGWYVEPTVFADVTNDMKIAQEEIFGPVLSVIPFDDEAQAIRIANDSDYGLCGSVWTADAEHGAAVAAQVRTGVVAINSAMILDFNAPFGGFKQSGIGRELGPEGIGPYTEYQSIILPA
ncbi:MAG: aldehyde dehydrogenase [Acidimicrobiia bacterium]|jgi:aldehyde dehydrogenase (NAD+)|uniref:aldehyde dehydrogenase (NAD(+)) n=1 Tax=freshwater metagenome TaxID=449393 RepID=A0A6J7RF54_9ZZZZ|nr:aldehyde dehydrogenase [Acidimicrobiia bacterium]MSV41055.1 aldehyde dehydrogenase family protein [Actinomycetota bacterium]